MPTEIILAAFLQIAIVITIMIVKIVAIGVQLFSITNYIIIISALVTDILETVTMITLITTLTEFVLFVWMIKTDFALIKHTDQKNA